MKTTIKYFLFIFILVFASCENREWDNPFDPDCPKELFTPANFTAKQEGNLVKLTWTQSNTQISGFVIERSIDGGATWSSITTPSKSELTWSDSNITGGKEHKYRLFAKAGNNHSNEVTAQVTPVFASTLSTSPLTKLLSTSAILGGEITSDGGSPVIVRGVCWSTSPNPTTNNSKTTDGAGTGAFTSTITGLNTVTTYYTRAYATTSVGTSYGKEISFKTFFGEVTDVEGNVYPTVKIGEQIWMAENLKVTKYNDGTTIPNVIDNTAWTALTTGAYCYYNNDAATNKATYGALYNWYAVNTNKLAPNGWHVPTDAEWTILTDYLGGVNTAGGKLKEVGTTHWQSPNTGATNETSFTALPAGYRDNNYADIKHISGFWSSTIYPQWNAALDRILASDIKSVYIGNPRNRSNGMSVRCILGTLNSPTVSTTTITNKTTISASSGGNITSDGGAPVTARGVCWSTSPNPTTANSKTTDGTGTGSFISNITGLTANTTYYVRSYAINSQGTAYGAEVSFTTSQSVSLATVTTTTVTTFTTISAVLGGNVTSDGNATVTERGVVYATTQNPTTANTKVAIGTGTGIFSNTVSGLTANTIYYVRAYATNSQGTDYGTQESFTTLSSSPQTVTDIEGNVYNTVTIGTQVWMAENLKTTKYNDETAIPNITGNTEWANLSSGAYCWYYNDIGNKLTYGALYNWYAVNTSKLCPDGWHMPSDAEWTILSDYLGYQTIAGGKMKTVTGWISPNTGASNSSGFSALPGGSRYGGYFFYIGYLGYWWSSTELSITDAWHRDLSYNYSLIGRYFYGKDYGFSVRCVKD